MEHDFNFSKVKEAVIISILDLEIKKDEYAQVCSTEKKRPKRIQEKAYLLPLNP